MRGLTRSFMVAVMPSISGICRSMRMRSKGALDKCSRTFREEKKKTVPQGQNKK